MQITDTGENNSPEETIEEQAAAEKTNQRRAAVMKALDDITEQTLAKCMNLLEKLAIPTDDTVESE